MENTSTASEKLIAELQGRLVQTCIDFIKEKNWEEIWGVEFNVNNLQGSVGEGKWTPSTDSYIKVDGLTYAEYVVNGKKLSKLPYRVTLGERG